MSERRTQGNKTAVLRIRPGNEFVVQLIRLVEHLFLTGSDELRRAAISISGAGQAPACIDIATHSSSEDRDRIRTAESAGESDGDDTIVYDQDTESGDDLSGLHADSEMPDSLLVDIHELCRLPAIIRLCEQWREEYAKRQMPRPMPGSSDRDLDAS